MIDFILFLSLFFFPNLNIDEFCGLQVYNLVEYLFNLFSALERRNFLKKKKESQMNLYYREITIFLLVVLRDFFW